MAGILRASSWYTPLEFNSESYACRKDVLIQKYADS